MGERIKAFEVTLAEPMVCDSDPGNMAVVTDLKIGEINGKVVVDMEIIFQRQPSEAFMRGFSGPIEKRFGGNYFIRTDGGWFEREGFYRAVRSGKEWVKNEDL